MESYISGTTGFQTAIVATPRTVFLNPNFSVNLAAGKQIDGANASDPDNTPDVNVLRAGILMGKITASGKYGASVMGVTAGALAQGATSLTVTAAQATELVRRVGTTGTFTLTGPPVASGTVRSVTVTYSAVNTTTGVVTITAITVNEVQTITPASACTGGTFKIGITDQNGVLQWTSGLANNATNATIQTAINAVIPQVGGVNQVVAGGGGNFSTPTALTLTFSGVNFPGTQPLVLVDSNDLTTAGTGTALSVSRTTAGVDGRFVTASLMGPTDGSQTPVSLISSDMDPYGIIVTLNDNVTRTTVPFPSVPITAEIVTANVINYPADSSLKAWVRTNLSTLSGGKFVFDDQF